MCSIAGAPALLEDARAAAEIMCSPFFCNHVNSTPFDGVSSMRNLRKLFVYDGENEKIA